AKKAGALRSLERILNYGRRHRLDRKSADEIIATEFVQPPAHVRKLREPNLACDCTSILKSLSL
ncbi:MAG: hypothetical protein OXC55_01560, partial [Chloroflexi bacterium]|nr:hypothetical protein [Chloroflexota bacterium]